MMILVVAPLVSAAAGAGAPTLKKQYLSCDLEAQHVLNGPIGSEITDPLQPHIAMRAEILQADLGNERTARRLTQATADRIFKRVAAIRSESDRYTRQQSLLNAAEVTSYGLERDAVAAGVCRH